MRLIVTRLKSNLIKAKVWTGFAECDIILIPRMNLCPAETGLPLKLNHRQFLAKPAFAKTINKSQGQIGTSLQARTVICSFIKGKVENVKASRSK